jgi:hypothetical protein
VEEGMLGRRRGLCRTVYLLAALMVMGVFAPPAGAVGNGVLDVATWSGPGGGFRVHEGTKERLFLGGFTLYMVDGPLAGRIFEGSEYSLGDEYTTLSGGPESAAGSARVIRLNRRARAALKAARGRVTVSPPATAARTIRVRGV